MYSKIYSTLIISGLLVLLSCSDANLTSEVNLASNPPESSFSNVFYKLFFDIPEDATLPITGEVAIGFELAADVGELVFSFDNNGSINSIQSKGNKLIYEIVGNTIRIKDQPMQKGVHEFVIEYTPPINSFFRGEQYTFTTADQNALFPHLDIANDKVVIKVEMYVSEKWRVFDLSSDTKSSVIGGGRKRINCLPVTIGKNDTFGFVVGDFQVKTINRDEELLKFYQVGTSEIGQLHQQVMDIMQASAFMVNQYKENSTSSGFKGVVMLPNMNTSMSDGILMIEAASDAADENGLAPSLAYSIAYEMISAALDKVIVLPAPTDSWFVESLAHVLADQVLSAQMDGYDPAIQFLFRHYPKAYAMDRSLGSHAIADSLGVQNRNTRLDNITLHKGAIVMRNLIQIVGENSFKFAVQEFVDNQQGKKATWQDLLIILDRRTDIDLQAWASVWINEAGLPHYKITFTEFDPTSRAYDIIQTDPQDRARLWPQTINVGFEYTMGPVDFPIFMDQPHHVMRNGARLSPPEFIHMGGAGRGYGVFAHGMGYERDVFLFAQGHVDISEYHEELRRAATYINLNEYLLDEGFEADLYINFLQIYLKSESNELIQFYLLDNIETVFDQFLTIDQRQSVAESLEKFIFSKFAAAENKEEKQTFLNSYIHLVSTAEGFDVLNNLMSSERIITQLRLRQKQEAIFKFTFHKDKMDDDYSGIISNIINASNWNDWQTLTAFFSKDQKLIDSSFKTLANEAKFLNEDLLLSNMAYLHHPDRNESSIRCLNSSLVIMSELAKTKSTQFIQSGLAFIIKGYQSKQALDIVDQYIIDQPSIHPYFKLQVLHSKDILERAVRNRGE